MSAAVLVAEALQAWRDAERELARFESGTPEHETARLLVLQLRDLYASLTELSDATADRIGSGRATMDQARETLGILQGRKLSGQAL